VQIPGEVVILNSVVLPDKEIDASYKNQIILWSSFNIILCLMTRLT